MSFRSFSFTLALNLWVGDPHLVSLLTRWACGGAGHDRKGDHVQALAVPHVAQSILNPADVEVSQNLAGAAVGVFGVEIEDPAEIREGLAALSYLDICSTSTEVDLSICETELDGHRVVLDSLNVLAIA